MAFQICSCDSMRPAESGQNGPETSARLFRAGYNPIAGMAETRSLILGN